ncbi:response regulator transcription factor [Sporomusa acidovorans]|uniref:response regulator transcription factor n=1 Tax=Sporomusa acidovorans TaxID=112900 RepID=UPI0008909533|nr:response regulator transcription factor [Sporomusa acidovorans]OZC18997.1 alkaline phosphatase synthesis transcriptional regulatory protein PhoP [Sporomusa acidovorans DSM 3132]SDD72471.1 DNA-binding response regulator, OmpR family, contains REC and winged-helix (wHTH) domain [Sporomusa acidovorans]
MSQSSVLVVDDDEKLVELLQIYFQRDGFLVYTANDGLTALQIAQDKQPDILVLDLMLPGMDGRDICRTLRRDSEVPILMLTARDEESDRLVGLEIGADDYVTKPFSPKEVVARVKAILRRTKGMKVKTEPLQMGDVVINTEQYQVTKGGQPVEITPTEFKILELLAANPGRVFSRLQIVEQTQGYSFEGYERTIDAHVKNLRRKIEDNPKEPVFIQTVYGVGYRMVGSQNE